MPFQTLLYQSFISLSSRYLHLGISLQSKDTSAIRNTTTQAGVSRTAAEMCCKGAINPPHPLSPPPGICSLNSPISSQSTIGLLPVLKLFVTFSSLLIYSHFPLPGTHSLLAEIYLPLWTPIPPNLSLDTCHFTFSLQLFKTILFFPLLLDYKLPMWPQSKVLP